jgi:VIT1/CCC1 family predicted Fe2+/Mn2+ transporter
VKEFTTIAYSIEYNTSLPSHILSEFMILLLVKLDASVSLCCCNIAYKLSSDIAVAWGMFAGSDGVANSNLNAMNMVLPTSTLSKNLGQMSSSTSKHLIVHLPLPLPILQSGHRTAKSQRDFGKVAEKSSAQASSMSIFVVGVLIPAFCPVTCIV